MNDPDLEQLGINVIRGLSMDAPQKANAGHPGTAMALAPLAHVLWTRIMRYDPSEPDWPNRDRFVLSCGHACILLYSMLYLTGYGLELADIESFRQVHSRCAGHPEIHYAAGIEVTTGPLGQGFANGVGLGIAERILRSRYSPELVDHHTFVICSDGDLMEGISHESASLAGHLGLGRLIYIYDDNHITIDGPTEMTLNDDPAKRFEAYGWHVEELGEIANDTDALEAAIRRAMAVEDKPSMLILRSHIGYPSPHKTDTSAAHGSPLGADEVKATKEIMGLPADEDFYVPDDVLAMYREAIPRGQALRSEWDKRLASWDGDREEWDALWSNQGMPGWQELLPTWDTVGEKIATRASINKALNAFAPKVPGLVSGGADLTGNTGTKLEGAAQQSVAHPEGRAIAYGVREHAMGGIMTGLSLHGGAIPVGGTFFVFSDYMRGAVRVAAISDAKVIYFWTHDSIGLGEDGPTHQPVEQLAAMRAMPNLRVIRPADANESAHALRVALERNGPTALILSRQGVPVLDGTAERGHELERGAYVLVPGDDDPDVVLIGTGSEVQLCVAAAAQLADDGLSARVVSMPSWELFDEQDDDYQDLVLGPGAPILSVEAATAFGWARWADDSVALDRYGLSGPGDQVMAEFGFTADHVADRARALVDDLDSFDLDESEDFVDSNDKEEDS
jgi:transketolase